VSIEFGEALDLFAQRYSIATVQPSTQPSSRSRRIKAAVHSTTREARRWSIVNLSILVSYKCKALMNVCAMARSVSL
jgi:hypothetical protein